MATCPTIRVKRDGEIITINEEDFNEETDSRLSEKAEAKLDAAITGDLDAMTKAELVDEAAKRGVEIATSATKAEIIDALNVASK